MLNYLTLIFSCQLAGELIVTAFRLPLPGPVVGMALLFVFMTWKGGVPAELARVGEALLSNLSLLFVPAGVGVMAHFALLRNDWLPLSAAVIGSTLATIAVTAATMIAINRLQGRAAGKGETTGDGGNG